MDLNDKVTQLEDEIKILKNEVQAVLLDLRESFLNNINPFNPNTIFTQAAPPIHPPVTGEPQETASIQVLTEEIEDVIPDIELESEDNFEEETQFPDPEEAEYEDDPPVFNDLDDDEGPSFFAESNGCGYEDTTQKEVNTVWQPETQTTPQFKTVDPINTVTSRKPKLELEAIAELSFWVEAAVKQLGHERTRTILDITETMGYIDPDLKSILVKFIHPVPNQEQLSITTKDYLACLVELNRLLQTDSRLEVALLFILILCQEYDNR
ncbi:MAG: hypothetical protein JW712_02965 [Dehalococcoidales bacterium]|nr:hypothetical protein [Dehalococcoidales bacterium]